MRLFALLSLILCLAGAALSADRSVLFNRDVRPILSDKCYGCHGPDAVAKKIPLRLDSEAAAKADLGSGRHAVVDGDPAASQLVQRITADKPAHAHAAGLLRAEADRRGNRDAAPWVAQGAKWQKHWSFIPPERPPLPAVKNTAWPRNPIDNFVLARLEREGLAPSPEASRETLLRRVSLDLTGLPPTPAEVDAFLSDQSPNAYEKVVDRLLASPRYGERMAERWLDAARYADTNGYQYDGERVMWRWRDWVIDAFNRNQPFDQFTLEQIAGDMLPNATLAQKIATGFNRNHRANTEDGIIPEEYAVEYVVDRVETTSTVFLGLTLGCARCHNHKYDPFTQKEFYQVFAYFNNVPELGRAMKYGNSPPLVPAPTAEQQRQHDELDAAHPRAGSYLRRIAERTARRAVAARCEGRAGTVGAGRTRSARWPRRPPTAAVFMRQDASATRLRSTARPTSTPATPATSISTTASRSPPGSIRMPRPTAASSAAWTTIPRARATASMLDQRQGARPPHQRLGGRRDSRGDRRDARAEALVSPHRHLRRLAAWREGVHVYIDGKPAKMQVLLDTLYRPFRNAGKAFTEPFRIGAGGGPERRFRGLIDDVHIYGRVLDERGDRGAGAGRIDRCDRAQAGRRSAAEIEKTAAALVLPGERRAAGNSRGLEAAHRAAAGERKAGAQLPHRDGDGGKPGAASRRTC